MPHRDVIVVAGGAMLRQPRLYEHVERRINDMIDQQRLAPGDRLPTEAEMCRLFQVSRSTLRLALRRLELRGRLVRMRGRGTFLATPGSAAPGNTAVADPGEPHPAGQKSIGLVFCATSDTDLLQMGILLGAENAAKSHGYSIMFGRSGEDERAEADEVARLLQLNVAGMIVMPVSNRSTTAGVRLLVDRKTPFVLVDRYLNDIDASYVISDNLYGLYRETEHLILLGYRRILFVMTTQADLGTTSARDRYSGLCQALRDYGLPECIQPPVTIDPQDDDQVRALILGAVQGSRSAGAAPGDRRPPAFAVLHDEIAVRMMQAASQLGLRPPEDFAMVGFDDLPVVSHLPVPLTTVAQQRVEMGFKAAHLLIDKIEGRAIVNDKIVLPVVFVVRESCGAHQIVRQRPHGPG